MPDALPPTPRTEQHAGRTWDESPWARYGLAAASAAAAALLTAALRFTAGAQNARVVFAFFYVAVFVAVWFGGRGSGGFSGALSILVAELFFLPAGLLPADPCRLLSRGFFGIISLLPGLLIG